MPFIKWNGYQVYYTEKGAGPPIIFLHNAGNDHQIWSHQIESFSRKYRVFAIDLLGCGRSQRPTLDYSLSLYSDMLSAFVKYHEFDKVILVGHCVGAATSLNYTLQNPEQVERLVIFNIATLNTLLGGPYGILFHLSQKAYGRFILGKTVALLSPPGWLNAMSISQQYGGHFQDTQTFLGHLQTLYQHPRQISMLYQLLLNFRSFAVLDEMNTPPIFPPTLLIWGRNNKILRVKGGIRFSRCLAPDRFEIVDDCGHMVMREKHAHINHLIEGFLEWR